MNWEFSIYSENFKKNILIIKDLNIVQKKYITARHYFNNIHYSKIPFYLSWKIFNLVFFFLLFLNKYTYVTSYILLWNLISFIFYLSNWFIDIYTESNILGRYTRKVRASLIFGFFLFLLSEIMLFSGFFWSFFDRIFHLSYATFNMSQLNGFETIIWYKTPLKATVLLLTSGYTLNYAYYMLRIGNATISIFFMHITLICAYLFLWLQLEEYSELTFTIADSVYASLFFLLTGFHGMHVLVGTIFIIYSLERLVTKNQLNTKHINFGLALIYWHFVDIIWIFLFIFIYMLNSWDFIFLVKKLNYIYYILY